MPRQWVVATNYFLEYWLRDNETQIQITYNMLCYIQKDYDSYYELLTTET